MYWESKQDVLERRSGMRRLLYGVYQGKPELLVVNKLGSLRRIKLPTADTAPLRITHIFRRLRHARDDRVV